MIRPTPNITGFDLAQRALRERFGMDVVFIVPKKGIPAAGTPTDPETGRAFDPFAAPASSTAGAEVPMRCSAVSRPLSRLLQPERENTAMGEISSDSLALILSPEQREAADGATHVTANGQRYVVREFRADETARVERYIAFCQKG